MFGPLLEQWKAPYAKKPDGSLIRARAVPPRLSFRPGPRRALPRQSKSQGRRDRRRRRRRRRARPGKRRHHHAGARHRPARRGRFLLRLLGLSQAPDRQGTATRPGSPTPTNCRSTARCPSGSTSSPARKSRLHPRLGAGSRLDVADPDAGALRLRLCLFRRIPHPRRGQSSRSSASSATRSRCAATSVSRSAARRRRGSATSSRSG